MPQPEDLVQLAIKKLLPRSIKRHVADAHRLATTGHVVVSFPKCGRTWLRAMLSMYYSNRYGLQDAPLLEFANLHYLDRRIPKIFFTHDCDSSSAPADLSPDKSHYASKRVIYLYRDPRDVAVSLYFHRVNRKKDLDVGIFDFMKQDAGGLRTVIQYMNLWAEAVPRFNEITLMSYEEMQTSPRKSLAATLEFLGEPVDDASLDAAVAGSSFDELKAIERSGSSSSKRLRPEDAENGDSYKVRRGKVGGYVDYFSLEEIEVVDKILSTHISALYPYK